MKYAVITFGCRVNQADSLGFEEQLLADGARPTSPERADLVVVNTCSVTATSDQGARQTIRRVARENPSAKIVVTGCYATREPEEVAALPNVVHVVANDDKPRLVPLIATWRTESAAQGESLFRVNPMAGVTGDGPCGAAIEPGVAGRTAFTLRVQTGCDEPCSYCVIPSTRGKPRSVPLQPLLREIERITESGFKEIALTGVHLGSYGRDLPAPSSLLVLLESVNDLASRKNLDVLFRISSLEPMDCTRDIVDLVATSDRFAPHFHLPLQHSSDRVLAAMRRPYSSEYYESLAGAIRSRMPNASIGSDVIVGFPGEDDDDHEHLASYLQSSPLTHIHVFPYSDRPGTAAASMSGKIHGSVIRARARRIREIGAKLTRSFRQTQVGTVHRALTLDDGTVAVTGNYLKLRIPPGRARNEWVQLRVTSHDVGELLTC